MKTKTKPKIKKSKPKKYEPYYLAIVLAAILLLEGALFSISTSQDWKNAASILDVSGAVVETIHDTASLFTPEATVVSGVNQFYQLAAVQMEELLQVSFENLSSSVEFTYDSISEFYLESSTQMALLLGVPNSVTRPQVAGASISR